MCSLHDRRQNLAPSHVCPVCPHASWCCLSMLHSVGPCFRCVFPKPPDPSSVSNCSDGGVLGVIPGVIGTLQALETIKLIIGDRIGMSRSGQLLLFDSVSWRFQNIKVGAKRAGCVACGSTANRITDFIDYNKVSIQPLPSSVDRFGCLILQHESLHSHL